MYLDICFGRDLIFSLKCMNSASDPPHVMYSSKDCWLNMILDMIVLTCFLRIVSLAVLVMDSGCLDTVISSSINAL